MTQMPTEIADIVNSGPRPLENHEYEKIVNWLMGNFQELLKLALHWLGRSAIPEDAEDAVQDFFAKRFLRVCEGYDPVENQNFVAYLCVCLRNHCWSTGKRLRGDDAGKQQPDDGQYLLEILHRLATRKNEQHARSGVRYSKDASTFCPLLGER